MAAKSAAVVSPAEMEKCPKCTKKVYPTEEIKGAGRKWHKACFRCHGDGCSISLTLASHKAAEGKVYCAAHVPKPKAKQVADSVAMKTALAAPKKASESVGNVQKGDAHKLAKENAIKPKPITGTNQAAPAVKAAPAEAAPAAAEAAPAPAEAAPAEAAPAEAAPAPAEAAPAEAAAAPAEAAPAEAAPAEAAPAEAAPAEAAPAEAAPAEAPPAEAAPPADG